MVCARLSFEPGALAVMELMRFFFKSTFSTLRTNEKEGPGRTLSPTLAQMHSEQSLMFLL